MRVAAEKNFKVSSGNPLMGLGLFLYVHEKMAVEAIEQYVNENEPRLTFEQKVARRALMAWRERV